MAETTVLVRSDHHRDDSMRYRRGFVLSAVVVLGTSCIYQPAPVPVQGQEAELSQLVGKWVGGYTSPEMGRVGSILFTLTANTDTAYGDVLMIPKRTAVPIQSNPDSATPGAGQPGNTILTIRFVRTGESQVRGELEEYVDVERGCLLNTSFEGTVSRFSIIGTFLTTEVESGRSVRGSWWVERRGD